MEIRARGFREASAELPLSFRENPVLNQISNRAGRTGQGMTGKTGQGRKYWARAGRKGQGRKERAGQGHAQMYSHIHDCEFACFQRAFKRTLLAARVVTAQKYGLLPGVVMGSLWKLDGILEPGCDKAFRKP